MTSKESYGHPEDGSNILGMLTINHEAWPEPMEKSRDFKTSNDGSDKHTSNPASVEPSLRES